MTQEINDNSANCELSMEQLDNIAGGGSFSSAVHFVEHGLKSIFTNPVAAGIGAGFVVLGAILTGGGNPPQRLN
jgi:hypothetical protein